MSGQIYLIRIWDSWANKTGDWDIESAALTREKAKEEQDRLAKKGHKTNVIPIRLVE